MALVLLLPSLIGGFCRAAVRVALGLMERSPCLLVRMFPRALRLLYGLLSRAAVRAAVRSAVDALKAARYLLLQWFAKCVVAGLVECTTLAVCVLRWSAVILRWPFLIIYKGLLKLAMFAASVALRVAMRVLCKAAVTVSILACKAFLEVSSAALAVLWGSACALRIAVICLHHLHRLALAALRLLIWALRLVAIGINGLPVGIAQAFGEELLSFSCWYFEANAGLIWALASCSLSTTQTALALLALAHFWATGIPEVLIGVIYPLAKLTAQSLRFLKQRQKRCWRERSLRCEPSIVALLSVADEGPLGTSFPRSRGTNIQMKVLESKILKRLFLSR